MSASTPTIEYDLSVIGMRDIERAFQTLEKRVAEHVRKVDALTATRGGRGAVGGAGGTGPANTNGRLVNAEREARRLAAITERTQKAEARNAEQWERHNTRIRDQRLREDEKAEKTRTRMIEREHKERTRIAQRSAKTEARVVEAEQRSAMRSRHETTARRVGFARAVGGDLVGIGRAGLAMTGLAGGALFANAAHDYAKTGAMATELAGKIQGKGATAQGIAAERERLLVNSMGVQGFSQQQVLGMAGSYGGITGDYAGGMAIAPQLAKVALATGGNIDELSTVAGRANLSLKGSFSGNDLNKMVMQSVRMFAGQGEAGAVEIGDLAKYAGRLTSKAGQFTGTREGNFTTLGAMAQVAMGSGASSAEDATTSVSRFSDDLLDKQKELRAIGIKSIFGADKKLRDPEELIVDIMKKTGGSLQKTNPLFGKETAKMIAGYSDIYMAAEEQKKGSGESAIRKSFANFRGATLNEADVNVRAASMQGEQGQILTENMKNLNQAIGKELVPVITDFIKYAGKAAPEMGSLAKATADTAKWFAANPFTGLGVVVSGAITKELLSAGIGKTINALLSGAGGIAGNALAAVGLGVSVYTATNAYLNASDTTNDSAAAARKIDSYVTNESNRISATGGSPEDMARAKLNMLDRAEHKLDKVAGNRGLVTNLLGGGKSIEQSIDARNTIAEQRAAAKAMLEAAVALKMQAAAGGGGGPMTSAPNRGERPGYLFNPYES